MPSAESEACPSAISEMSVLVPPMSNGTRSEMPSKSAQREKLDEIISRIGALEREVATLTLRFAEMKVDFANLSVRIDNLAEMEIWYDQWLKALGSAVIIGPSDFAGQITSVGLADMQPPKRSACRRLESRPNRHRQCGVEPRTAASRERHSQRRSHGLFRDAALERQ